MNKVDFFIVGQGLAGSLLAAELLAAGKSIRVFDADHQGAASAVAAGIVNPITGRRLVKSWMIDALIPKAIETYQRQEKLLQQRFLYQTPIQRAINEVSDENLWITRSGYADNITYLSPDLIPGSPEGMRPVMARGIIQQACRVDLPSYINAWKNYFLEHQLLEQTNFDYSSLIVESDQVKYENWTANKIIFCEGHQVINNPWFNFIPMVLAKGEVVILDIPNLAVEEIYKSNLTYVRIGGDRFWVGATYDWKFENGAPTETGKTELIEKIEADLAIPYQLIDHHAAIRPTIKDRRPALGSHPKFSNLILFNGLGTKGASLGPYWSSKMVRYLIHGDAIDASVNLDRFV